MARVGICLALALVASPAQAAMPPAPYLVKDTNTRTTFGTNSSHMTAVGDTLYFVTGGWPDPPVLWKTDGTAAGTVPVADVDALRHPIAFGDALVFGGAGLWTSDGTEAGTRLIGSIETWETETGSSSITCHADTLFVVGNGALWRSDGTPEGTMLVKSLEKAWPNAHQVTTVRGMLVLLHGRGVWTSDGTPEGTRRIVPLGTDVSSLAPGSLTSTGDLAFFTSCVRRQCELWRTDGTDEGTFALATLVARYGDDDGDPRFRTAVVEPNGTFFVCTDSDDAWAADVLWASAGTVEGTRRLTSAECFDSERPTELAAVGGALIFSQCDSETGCNPWRSDGTPEGTGLLLDLEPGPTGSGVQVLGSTGEAVFFAASAAGGGTELWRTDGTAQGTVAVSPVPAVGSYDYDDDELRLAAGTLGETLFFSACTAGR